MLQRHQWRLFVAVLGSTNLLDNTNFWGNSPVTEANTTLAGYALNSFADTNINAGQALQQNYTALPATASISGRVMDNLGNPVTGVSLYATTLIGGINYQSLLGQTDNSGKLHPGRDFRRVANLFQLRWRQ